MRNFLVTALIMASGAAAYAQVGSETQHMGSNPERCMIGLWLKQLKSLNTYATDKFSLSASEAKLCDYMGEADFREYDIEGTVKRSQKDIKVKGTIRAYVHKTSKGYECELDADPGLQYTVVKEGSGKIIHLDQ